MPAEAIAELPIIVGATGLLEKPVTKPPSVPAVKPPPLAMEDDNVALLLGAILREYAPTTIGPTREPTRAPTLEPAPTLAQLIDDIVGTLPLDVQADLCEFLRACPPSTLAQLKETVRSSDLSSTVKSAACMVFERMLEVPILPFEVTPEPTLDLEAAAAFLIQEAAISSVPPTTTTVAFTHLRAHET